MIDGALYGSTYLQTGWWFNYVYVNLCGTANLNGLRYACGGSKYQYTGKYLSWGHLAVEDAYMYLRPRDYPDYDSHQFETTPSTPESYLTSESY
uniref:Uncharacterized protein n=1 Tax=Panagrolaimus sp. PS1159 TaxID=55785 RepID=A0AC35F252_9BILA